MEKDQPPPYSAATGIHPLPGFSAPPPESSKPQQYPPEHGHPQPYPQQHGHPQPYPQQHGHPPPFPTQPGHPQPFPTQPGHPLSQPGYPPSQHQYSGPGGTTVIVTSAPIPSAYGPNPQPMACPHCHQQITTRIDNEPSMRTHIIALVCCLMGCIPCCIIPYFMESCQTRNHYCPCCGAFLGNYNSDAEWNRRW